eukprot:2688043-Amphidinium_carterae.1
MPRARTCRVMACQRWFVLTTTNMPRQLSLVIKGPYFQNQTRLLQKAASHQRAQKACDMSHVTKTANGPRNGSFAPRKCLNCLRGKEASPPDVTGF